MSSFSIVPPKCSDNIHAKVQVFQSPLHADGVQAICSISTGDCIFQEQPFSFLQTIENRQCNAICAGCHCFLGSLELQIGLLTRKIARQDQHAISQNSNKCIIMCCNQCGELYCSEQCRILHWNNQGHALLCTGTLDESDPLVQFKIHAVQTNEIFLLVADIYAQICVDIAQKTALGRPLEDAIATSMIPFEGYVRQLWWDAAVAPKGSDPLELRSTLYSLVQESWNLLDAALQLTSKGLAVVLGPEYMSRLIGMFEQNNVGVRVVSPLGSLCAAATPGAPVCNSLAEAAEAIAEILEESQWEDCTSENDADDENGEVGGAEEEEEEEVQVDEPIEWTLDRAGDDAGLMRLYSVLNSNGIDAIFPPLDGTAFYSLICKINHSCEPNVIVKYPAAECDRPTALVAQLSALRNIYPGEELVQSYIDQSMSWEMRVAALKDYGFECFCRKCQLRG